MKFYVINNATKEFLSVYDSDVSMEQEWGPDFRPPFATHVPVPAGLDPECAAVISWQETVTVTDPETEETHEELVTRFGFELSTTLWEQKQERLRKEAKRAKIEAFKASQALQIEEETGIPYADTAGVDYVGLLDMEANPAKFMQAGVPGFGTAAEVKAWATAQLEPYRRITRKRGPARRRLAEELST